MEQFGPGNTWNKDRNGLNMETPEIRIEMEQFKHRNT